MTTPESEPVGMPDAGVPEIAVPETAAPEITAPDIVEAGAPTSAAVGIPSDGIPSDGEPAARRRLTPREALVVGARTTTGIVVAAVAVGVVIAATTLQPPSWSVAPASTVVTPQAAASRLLCSGAPLRLADDTGADASSASPLTTPASTVAGDGVVGTSALPQSSAGTGTDDAPLVIDVAPASDGSPRLAAGTQASLLTAGDTRGLATETCAPPAARHWLLAGSTAVGRTSLLSVSNPTTVAAVVDLEILTGSGRVDAPGMTGIDVPAGTQRIIPIAGFVLDAESIAIRVTSTGGNVVATLQSSAIRTLEPGGIDLATPVGDPATRLTIPGVVVEDGAALDALSSRGAGWDDAVTAVRLLAPGEATSARVLLVPVGMSEADAAEAAAASGIQEGGEGASVADVDLAVARPRLFEIPLTAGVVVDLPVPKLATGEYTVVVTADAPVLAAVRLTAAGAAGVDLAWIGPARPLAQRAVLAVPEADAPRLALANPTAADATVDVSIDGAATSVAVAAGTTVLVPVEPGAAVALEGTGGLVASVVSGGDGMIAVSPVLPPPPASRPVTVYP